MATEAHHPKKIWILQNQIKGLTADGTGGTKDDQAQGRGQVEQGTAAGIQGGNRQVMCFIGNQLHHVPSQTAQMMKNRK